MLEYSLEGLMHWIFIGRIDAEAPILWPHDVKSQFTGKDLDAGKDWGHEKKGVTEDEMIGWHHELMDMSLGKLKEIVRTGKLNMLQSMGLQRVGHDWTTEQQLTLIIAMCYSPTSPEMKQQLWKPGARDKHVEWVTWY